MLRAGIDKRCRDISRKSGTREEPGPVTVSSTGLVVDAVRVVVFELMEVISVWFQYVG